MTLLHIAGNVYVLLHCQLALRIILSSAAITSKSKVHNKCDQHQFENRLLCECVMHAKLEDYSIRKWIILRMSLKIIVCWLTIIIWNKILYNIIVLLLYSVQH